MSATESTAASSPDADAVQRAKREIQGILDQIAELARSEPSTERFFEEFLNRVIAALAAAGGAVWLRSDAGVPQLVYQVNLRQTGLAENPIGQAQHGGLLQRVFAGGEAQLVAPHSGYSATGDLVPSDADEHAPANPTDFLLVLAPVSSDQGPQGVVEVFQRPGARTQVQQGYLRYLREACELAGDFLRRQRLQRLSEKQSLWEQLESFTRRAHQGLDVREAAYTVANEGRRLIGADRVTVAVGPARRLRIEAISGQDVFDRRSNVATLLTKAARAVARTAEDVWYTGDTATMAPQVERAIDAYVDTADTKAMVILPLLDRRGDDDESPEAVERRKNRPPRVVGALIVEQMVDNRIAEGFPQRVEVVRSHSETALANALEHEGLFLMPLWKALGKAGWLFQGRTLPKTVAATAAAVGLAAAALLVQKDFELEGDGKLRPAELRSVFAPEDGLVRRVAAEYEQSVRRGDVLVEMENRDLGQELVTTRGALNNAITELSRLRAELLGRGKEMSRAEREENEGRLATLAHEVDTHRRELELLEQKIRLLTVTSPIDGQVITFHVEEQLRDRPIRRGQALMEVANPDGDWLLEVYMPEKRMGHVTRALKEAGGELRVEFLLATTTETTLEGRLLAENVSQTAEVRSDEGATVLLRVLFDQNEFRAAAPNPKVGSEVKARVACGRRSLAYSYLHDLLDFLRAKVLFRI